MLTALFIVFSTFLSVVSAQSFAGFSNGDGLTTIALVICSLFTLLFFVQIIHCFVVWVLASGHRLSYVALFISVLCSLASCGSHKRSHFHRHIYGYYVLVCIFAVNDFFAHCGAISLYISLIAFLFDRRRAISNTSGGKIATHENVVLIAIHFSLVLLLLICGTASSALWVDADVHYFVRNDITISVFNERRIVSVRLRYAFNAFLCLSIIIFLGTTLSLYKSARRSGVRDPITSILLYVISLLYALFNLCGSFIFVIMFSKSGIRFKLKDNKPYRNASIAADFLIQFFYFATAAALLLLARRHSNWDVQPAAGTNPEPYAAHPYAQSYAQESHDTLQNSASSHAPPPLVTRHPRCRLYHKTSNWQYRRSDVLWLRSFYYDLCSLFGSGWYNFLGWNARKFERDEGLFARGWE